MAINQAIYGTPEQWSNAFFQQAQITNKNRLASFGTGAKTLFDGVTAGKLSYDIPIDKSLSYCGLGTVSAMSHVVYCGLHDNAFQAYDSTDRKVTNFAFFEKQTSTNYLSQGNIWLNQLNRVDWSKNIDTEWNYTKDLIPYTVVNPHNMILVIFLSVSNGDGVYYDMTLEYFVRTFSQYNWTRISRVKIVPYFGSNTDGVAWSASAGYNPTPQGHSIHMSILDEYVVSAKNKRFYMYENPTFEWIPFGFVGANSIGSLTDTNIVYMCYIPEPAKNRIKYDNTNREFYIEYYDGMVEDILKTVACFGLYFSTTTNDLGNVTNEYTYIGLIDSDGIGRGRYLQGADTVNAPQIRDNWTDMSNTGYTPSADDTKYRNDTQFYSTWSSSAFTKMYVLTESQVQQLAAELYTAVSAAPTSEEIERYNQSVFLTQNPIDCIISLKRFPIELPYSAAVPMKLGSYKTQVNAAPLLYSTGVYSFVFSRSVNNNLYQWFDKSFLDYEPYTKVELTIPFCGTVEIPTTYIYDYDTIDVKLIIDYITGACTAYIQARNVTIDSVSGECAVTLPVNGIQSATLDSQIHSAATARNKSALTNGLGLIGGLAAVGIGIATGGIGTAVIGGIAALTSGANMVVQDKNIEYELQHMQVPLKQIDSASGAIAQSYDMRCKMRITRPKIAADYNAEVYASTIGFACLINTTVNSLSGLTVGDINLDNVAASDVEKQLIKNAFAGGVIL